VGQLAAHAAVVRGAEKVILIDNQEYRLQFARDHIKGNIETINFDKVKVGCCNPT
jgi:threonine dehydrogenase-like Zn-dependent dehydrogenase